MTCKKEDLMQNQGLYPFTDLNGNDNFTGQFVVIADSKLTDEIKWKKLLEVTNNSARTMFTKVLDAYIEKMWPNKDDVPHFPDEDGKDYCDNNTSDAFVNNNSVNFEMSLMPGYSTTKKFRYFTVRAEFEVNERAIYFKFVNVSPIVKHLNGIEIKKFGDTSSNKIEIKLNKKVLTKKFPYVIVKDLSKLEPYRINEHISVDIDFSTVTVSKEV